MIRKLAALWAACALVCTPLVALMATPALAQSEGNYSYTLMSGAISLGTQPIYPGNYRLSLPTAFNGATVTIVQATGSGAVAATYTYTSTPSAMPVIPFYAGDSVSATASGGTPTGNVTLSGGPAAMAAAGSSSTSVSNFPNGFQALDSTSTPYADDATHHLVESNSAAILTAAQTTATAQGAPGTGITQPTGGSGLMGWLSGIYKAITGTLTVSGTVTTGSGSVATVAQGAPNSGTASTGWYWQGLETAGTAVTGGGVRMMGSYGPNPVSTAGQAQDIDVDQYGRVVLGSSTALIGYITGNVASGATDTGNPVKVGGVAGVLGTAVATGARVEWHGTLYGEQYVSLSSGGIVIPLINGTGGQSISLYGLSTAAQMRIFDGTQSQLVQNAPAANGGTGTGVQAAGMMAIDGTGKQRQAGATVLGALIPPETTSTSGRVITQTAVSASTSTTVCPAVSTGYLVSEEVQASVAGGLGLNAEALTSATFGTATGSPDIVVNTPASLYTFPVPTTSAVTFYSATAGVVNCIQTYRQ